MGFQVSPGVQVKEIDLTNVIPAVSTSIGAIAGAFQWGPVGEIITVGSEKQLVSRFGEPNNDTYQSFMPAASFLKYGKSLRVVRADASEDVTFTDAEIGAVGFDEVDIYGKAITSVDDIFAGPAKNASSGTLAVTVKNDEHFDNGDLTTLTTPVGSWIAKFPGAIANGLQIYSVTSAFETHTLAPALADLETKANSLVAATVTAEVANTNLTAANVALTAANAALANNTSTDQSDIDALQDTINLATTAQATAITANIDAGTTLNTATDSVNTSQLTVDTMRSIKSQFDKLPDGNEVHFSVVDAEGVFGEKGSVLESFEFLSMVEGTVGSDGSNNFYVDVINATSNYIRSMVHIFTDLNTAKANLAANESPIQSDIDALQAAIDTELVDVFPFDVELSGGTVGTTTNALRSTQTTTLDIGDLTTGFKFFEDPETVDVNLIIQGSSDYVGASHGLANQLIALASTRKDCVAFVSPPLAASKQNLNAMDDVIEWADKLTSSSYGVIDSTALYVYDKYSDLYRWISASGAVAGLCAKTDDVADPWWSPAGFNRGQLFGVTKLAFNPKHFERDELYKKRINPIVTFPGEGTLLYGDKTAQSKPSAFDRINVRRLFIVLEKAIATAAKYQLFEFNDEFTRAQFRNMVEPFLRDVKGRRGLYDFHVVCDETNNTGQVIDTNQFIADIYIKPARSINFMTLNFIATRTGVEFSEIIGK